MFVAGGDPGGVAADPFDVVRFLAEEDGVIEIEDDAGIAGEQPLHIEVPVLKQIAVHECDVIVSGGLDVP